MVLDNLDAFIGFNASQKSKTKILTNIRLIKRHSMYSDKRKQEERYPYFLAIQITVVELPCEFSYLFGGLALTVLNILLRNTCTHFLFHSDYYFFQNGPYFYSERFRKRNLEIKHVSIQSTWGRLGSLINVKLASWQKCKQARMKSRPCRVIQ